MTRVMYDMVGENFDTRSGAYKLPQGNLFCKEIDVPEGKRFVRMDTSVEPHVPVFEDLPTPPTESIASTSETLDFVLTVIIPDLLDQIMALDQRVLTLEGGGV